MADQNERQIILRDGRKLGYAEYGDPVGEPIFLFHGIPGSRMIRHPDVSIAEECRVRLIVPERPGMGLSDFKPGRRLLDWPSDVQELADALEIKKFSAAGFSGGGPYALACGYAIPHRLTTVGLISAVGPTNIPGALDGMLSSNRMGYSVGRWIPWSLWKWVFELYYSDVAKHPETLAVMHDDEPESDHVVFKSAGVRQVLVETFSEAFRQGTIGAAQDGWLLARLWGFPLEEISVPVYLWQGEADVVVTQAMGRYMAAQIPNCSPTFFPDEGHLIFFTHWREILRSLMLVDG
jgi:pimeloyl-ACP methyl ester carboxylesterase